MMCESDGIYVSPTPIPPSHSQVFPPSTPPPLTPPRKPTDTCFSCKRQGHWAFECPNKTLKHSSPASASSSPALPLVRCPCGRGICSVKTANTQRNAGRKFYSCPGGRAPVGCNFFKWCEDFENVQVPRCPCGAGECSLNKESSGPDAGRWFFACRIKKSQGACGFFQWVDCQVKMVMDGRTVLETTDSSSPPSKIPIVGDSEIAPDLSVAILHSEKDKVPNHDLVVQALESWVPMKKKLRLSNLFSQSYIRTQKTASSLENSATGSVYCEEVIYQFLCLQLRGWLGRLLFPPSLKEPALVPFSPCVFPTIDPIVEDLSNVESPTPPSLLSPPYCEYDEPQPQICGKDPPLSVSSPHIPGVDTQLREPFQSKTILRCLGQGLLDIIQSMSPSEHEKMQVVAEVTFDAFQRLSVDHTPFSNRVKEYIYCASKLSRIGGTLRKDVSSQELIDLFSDEKARFDTVSHLLSETKGAQKAAEDRVKSLREEASHIRELLLQIETELSCKEVEALELQTRVAEISKEVLESEKSMEAAYQEMESALNLEHLMDAVLDAAKAALDGTRKELLQ